MMTAMKDKSTISDTAEASPSEGRRSFFRIGPTGPRKTWITKVSIPAKAYDRSVAEVLSRRRRFPKLVRDKGTALS